MSIQDQLSQFMANNATEVNPWDYLEFFIMNYPVDFGKVYNVSEPGSPKAPYKWMPIHVEEVIPAPIDILVGFSKEVGIICVPKEITYTTLSATKADKLQLARRVKAEFSKGPKELLKQEAYRKLLNITEDSWNKLSPRYDTVAVHLFHKGDMSLPKEELLKTHVPISLEAYKAYIRKVYGHGNHCAPTWCFRGVVDPSTGKSLQRLVDFKNIPVISNLDIPELFYIEIKL